MGWRGLLTEFPKRRIFKAGSQGGPGRLLGIAGVAAGMIALVVGVMLYNSTRPPESKVAKLPHIDPLPGGTNSTPELEALRLMDSQEKAEKAGKAGTSFTPVVPGSINFGVTPVNEPGFGLEAADPKKEELKPEKPKEPPPPEIHVVEVPKPVYVPPPPPRAETPVIQKVNSTGTIDAAMFKGLFDGYDGRLPQTAILMEPSPAVLHDGIGGSGSSAGPGSVGGSREGPREVLVPAGRGVFAHTIVAVDSDRSGPIVLEADSGAVAGDRMIGTFAKSGIDRLVVKITKVVHGGEVIAVEGLAVAPETMETAVATSIDQHYLERFVLPGAVAFVEGLAQAVELSNSTISSAFGQTTQSFGPMKFKQEAEIGVGAAAQAVGNALSQSIPTGPTIKLAVNAGVGVIFLEPVSIPKAGVYK
jgi:intracellular multiplication protein IcmE